MPCFATIWPESEGIDKGHWEWRALVIIHKGCLNKQPAEAHQAVLMPVL